MTRKSILTVFAMLAIILTLPMLAVAAPTDAPSNLRLNDRVLPDGPLSVLKIVEAITDWIFTALLLLSVIFVLLAAYHYMSGSEESVQKAHRMLLYTAVAVAVAVLSFGLVGAIRYLVEEPQNQRQGEIDAINRELRN